MADRLLVGMHDIGAHRDVAPSQVHRWMRLRVDPLRVSYLHKVPRILASKLDTWWKRHHAEIKEKPMKTWPVIAEMAEMSVRAAIRASKQDDDPLPVFYQPDGTVCAWYGAVTDWRDDRILTGMAHRALHPKLSRRGKVKA